MISPHLGIGFVLGGTLLIIFPSISEKIDSYHGYDISYIDQIRSMYKATQRKANWSIIIMGIFVFIIGRFFERLDILYSSRIDLIMIIIILLIYKFIILRSLEKTLNKFGYYKKQSGN